MKNKVIVIVGPTASGKSTLAVKVAQKLNGVVISADSMQIYRKLDVGTAKIAKEKMQGIPHELIDICDIDEKFDVAKYKDMCYTKIEEAILQGKVPIIVGGTGLYINAVVNNVNFETDVQDNIKAKSQIEELDKTMTTDDLYNYLLKIDKESASMVDRKNRRRVLRAIYLKLNGSSKAKSDKASNLWAQNGSDYNFFTVYIDIPRDLLYDRIEKRIDSMVDEGIIDEARMLYNMRDNECTAVQAIGYKEFFSYFEGTLTLAECVELLKKNTRHYAKRQITWFKKLQNKLVIDGTINEECLVEQILEGYYGDKT